ncbi:hypothetical protein [Cronobacter malonaticus]|uniref:hypothetical protein n=1 Tax=Cronobacter malonaticus TaxID=413503 RepID=UPI00131A18B5|nr:hypothetical protein [Cronobacter malonaticus]
MSNVVLSGRSVGVPPERMTIIIIIIRMCPAFFEKNLGIDPQEKTLDVEDYFIGRVSHAFSPFNRRPQGARHE